MKLRRPSGALLASTIVHLVVVSFFAQALIMDRPLFDFFDRVSPVLDGDPAQRVTFVELPVGSPLGGGSPGETEQRRGQEERPQEPPPPQPLEAPVSVPQTIPPPPPPPPSIVDAEPSTGPLTGGQGQLRGVQPRYGDGRLWGAPNTTDGAPSRPPLEGIEQLDSVTVAILRAYYDSVYTANAGKRDPGDWTIERGGHKYGIDRKFIRLGPVSIPTAVLALLPLNITNNPSVSQRERQFNANHSEIMEHARRGMDQADFNKAVRALRERKERERKEKEKEKREREQQAEANEGSSSSSTPSSDTK